MSGMHPPDVAFLVLSSAEVDGDGKQQLGSKVVQFTPRSEPPEWRLRDFGFAAFSFKEAQPGLREVHFGRRSVWVFATPCKNCEEIVIFRRTSDTKRRWDGEALHEPKVGLDRFFLMRSKQITKDTPLSTQFHGEWGFWESFFVPILDDERTSEILAEMAAGSRTTFSPQEWTVTCHSCPVGREVLKVPEDMVVRYKVRVACTRADQWNEICDKLGNDMVLQDGCVVAGQVLKAGSDCVKAISEMDGELEGSRLKKHSLETLKLPVTLEMECDMNVHCEWRPDLRSLQRKIEVLGQAYETNLLNGYSALGRERPDPWNPMARLAVNALNQVFGRFPDIRTVLDVGCGDMAWMQYVLQDHPELTYVGCDILPFCLAANFRRFPKMHFLQTDLSCSNGMEVLPRGCDLVIAKEVFNQMVLPDAVAALRRVVALRPRFLLVDVGTSSENKGWENRLDQHLELTPYDYNKHPFSLPYPVIHVQKISDDVSFVLYEVCPTGSVKAPALVQDLPLPAVGDDLDIFTTACDGEWTEPEHFGPVTPAFKSDGTVKSCDELGPKPEPAMPKTSSCDLNAEVAKPIKGVPAAEFRTRCDLIFEKFDIDRDDSLLFEELVALMDAGGRRIEEYEAYSGLCTRLRCDPRVGLSRKAVYTLFEKAPQSVWAEVYRSINPLAQMVRRGPDKIPETFLEKQISNFIFDDGEDTAKVVIDLNDHLYFGAAEYVIFEQHVQAFLGKQRLEVHIVAPGSYEAKDLFLWKFMVTPLAGEIVPEDSTIELKNVADRAGVRSSRIIVKLVKSRQKKWGRVGQAVTGQRI